MVNGLITLAIVAALFAALQILAAATGVSNRRPSGELADGASMLASVVLWLVVSVVCILWAAERDRQQRVRDAKYHRTFTNEVDGN